MYKIFLLLIVALLFAITSQSQGNKAVYGEFVTNGLGFSVNYDMRFSKNENGFGFRAGIGFTAATGISSITFPLGLNYLVGKGPHHLELGFGVTPVSSTVTLFGDRVTGSEVFFIPTIGYRYAQKRKGFVGRIFAGPVIVQEVIFFPWGGVSVGIKF